jgi:hypothetical protein
MLAYRLNNIVRVVPRTARFCAFFGSLASLAAAAPPKATPPAATPVTAPATAATGKAPAGAPATKPQPATSSKPSAPVAAVAPPTVPPPPKKPAHVAARPVTPPPRAPEAVSKDEVAALRAEVTALRAELNQALGAPPPVVNPEREQLESQLGEAKKQLAAIQTAIDGGLDREAVADSITKAEARVAELQAALDQLNAQSAASPTPSLYQVSADVQRLNAAVATQQAGAGATVTAAAAPTPPKPLIAAEPPAEPGNLMKDMGLLPLEFTAFGDFFYRFERPGADDFHVGAVELDASLKLTPYVNVSTAIAYSGDDESFGLGAFVIDCGLFGEGEDYPLASKLVSKSGVSFGLFDVPFGIAYLQYPATDNYLVTLPQAVELTHGAWNDMGAQGYAVGKHWTAVGYVVNGQEYPTDAEGGAAPSRVAAGGRLSGKVDELIEVGGSAAMNFAQGPRMFLAGGDVQATLGPLDLRGEYLLKHVDTVDVPEFTHGVYGQGFFKLDPAFLVARYDTVLEGSQSIDRRLAGGGGVEVFPQGQVRAVYEQSIDTDVRMVTLQLVGGSSFQPTGLRR